jgi:hypothetical protein
LNLRGRGSLFSEAPASTRVQFGDVQNRHENIPGFRQKCGSKRAAGARLGSLRPDETVVPFLPDRLMMRRATMTRPGMLPYVDSSAKSALR